MRWVAHIDMDAFYASVEQLTRPTLRDRPVLVGGMSGRGVVAGASYEAREYGARSAMPMHQAIRLCRNRAIVVQPRSELYKTISRRIFQVIAERAGVVEQLSVDEGFAEPQGLADAAAARRWAEDLQRAVEEATELPCSIGMASTKLDAKMASDLAKPHGIFVVEDRMATFGPRPVGDLWGIGRVAQAKLADVGVYTIQQFVDMDPTDVKSLLGKVGLEVQVMAGGDDPRPVAPRAEAKQISAEQTLPVDARTYRDVLNIMELSARQAYRRLRKDGRAARTITVKIRTSDFALHTRSTTLPAPTDDFEQLLRAARAVLPRPEDSGAVRLVGVGFSGLSHDRQEMLFPELSHPAVPHQSVTQSATTVAGRGEVPAGAEAAGESHPGGAAERKESRWQQTQDVWHPDYGHGWVQGSGVGVVTVRFETRETGPGRIATFDTDDPQLQPADPLDSLAWGTDADDDGEQLALGGEGPTDSTGE